MKKEDIDLLERNGWEVECQSPFEIRNDESGSFATGEAAQLILQILKDEQEDYFTEEQLIKSDEFLKWTKNQDVVKIHNTYHDAVPAYAAYIVIGKTPGDTYQITRFWQTAGRDKISVSVDHEELSAHNVFHVLLTQYSSGLR